LYPIHVMSLSMENNIFLRCTVVFVHTIVLLRSCGNYLRASPIWNQTILHFNVIMFH